MTWRGPCLLAAIAAVATGCSDEVERGDYVAKNAALLKTVPAFPGARLGRAESSGYPANEQSDAIVGYKTSRTDALPARTRSAAAIAYYRRTLPRRGWKLLDGTPSFYFNFRKDDAYLHVLAGGGVIDLEVDHAYCRDESFGCGGD